MGLFKSKAERLERFKSKLIRKGKTPDQIKRRLNTRSAVQDIGSGLSAGIVGIASTFISGFPVAGIAGKVLSTMPEVIKKIPVLKEIAAVGAIQFDAKVIKYGGVPQAILADIMPMIDEIRDGEYLKAGLTLAIIVAAVGLYFLI